MTRVIVVEAEGGPVETALLYWLMTRLFMADPPNGGQVGQASFSTV